ncbi:hypothetical protein BX666DRAFT_2046840 [Dichotomocladium elegans]|nr:hypothetical protein BX666DRAFT_2046840 [Dichotomocladium elegans]
MSETVPISTDLPHLQQLAQQLELQQQQMAHQQQLLEALYQEHMVTSGPQVPPVPHDLPVHPSFDWTPTPDLTHLMLTLDQNIFTSTLADKECLLLIEQYPPIQGLSYVPLVALPQAGRLFNCHQKAKENRLYTTQYALSAVFRPLDVLGHMLLLILPSEHMDRVFATINDIRALLLHTEGMLTAQQNHLALRVVNPSIQPQDGDCEYTMTTEEFKDTIASHSTLQKTLRDVCPSRNRFRPTSGTYLAPNPSFFRGGPSGDGGHPDYFSQQTFRLNNPFRPQQQNNTNRGPHRVAPRPNRNNTRDNTNTPCQ